MWITHLAEVSAPDWEQTVHTGPARRAGQTDRDAGYRVRPRSIVKGCFLMESQNFDTLTKQLSAGTNRRRALVGLGALALGSVGIVSRSQMVAAQVSADDKRRKCIDRCVGRGGTNNLKDRRQRCRRKCQNR
jgi:hypothetical protein